MVWKVPTREIGGMPYDEGLELPPEYLARNPGTLHFECICTHNICGIIKFVCVPIL